MKPRNFAFIDDFIAGSAIPDNIDHLKFYKENGINRVISLTADRPLVMYHNNIIEDHHLAISSTPSDRTIKKYIDILRDAEKNNEKVVVHCQFGQERTGIMLIIYLVEIKGMNKDDAIRLLREKRPVSLKTYHAIQYLNNRYIGE